MLTSEPAIVSWVVVEGMGQSQHLTAQQWWGSQNISMCNELLNGCHEAKHRGIGKACEGWGEGWAVEEGF